MQRLMRLTFSYIFLEIIYIVKVFTGNKFGAGTDANVFLKLFGSQGDSGEIHLRESNNTNKFEKKQVVIAASSISNS